MKIADGMKIINEGWITKPKGFRVKYEKLEDGKRLTQYSPGQDETLLDSDVTAWRYAWKLYMSTKSQAPGIKEGEFVNLHVVDDSDNAIAYYVNGENEVLNPK